jgi:glycosyltransferase involved in cell wall biosynthesis
MNENDAYVFQIEEPADWSALPGRCEIRGWFHTKIGAVFHDVRAVVGHRVFPGIWGVPRPDIHARWPERGLASLLCGLRFPIALPATADLVRLEILDAGYGWGEFWRVPVRVRPGTGAALPPPAPDPRLIPSGLRRLLQRAADPAPGQKLAPPPLPSPDSALAPDALARRLVRAAATGHGGIEVLPEPPLHGWLDDPVVPCSTRYRKVFLRGWAFHETQPIARFYATTSDHQAINELGGGQERPDAGHAYPQFPHAARSQFTGLVDLDENHPGPALLRVWGELADGSVHLLFTRRIHQIPVNTDDRPLPPYALRTFLTAARLWHAAVRAEGLSRRPWRASLRALRQAHADFKRRAPTPTNDQATETDYARWVRRNEPSPRLAELLLADGRRAAASGPRLSLVVDVAATPPEYLAQLVESVRAQSYPAWELLLCAPGEGLRSLVGDDARIRPWADSPGEALRAATGEFVAFPPADGRLPPHALLRVAEAIAAHPAADLFTTDDDVWDHDGRRRDPQFRGAWNPALVFSGAYPGPLTFFRRRRVLAVGGLREDFAACARYDLLLRFTEALPAALAVAVPHLGWHARRTPFEAAVATPAMMEQARRALDESLRRRGLRARAVWPEFAVRHRLPWLRLQWDPRLLAERRATIVVPTRDRIDLLQRCLQALDHTVDWRHAELVLVDDFSRDAKTVRFLRRMAARADVRCRIVQPDDWRQPFNYSRLVNLGTAAAQTPLVVHLNNDVDAVYSGWLEDLAGWMSLPDVGVVGARLLYADHTLNHAGVVVGAHDGLADCPFVGLPESDTEFAPWHQLARDTTAVTGACLITDRALYAQLAGFDEQDFGVAYNDIDYCLKAQGAGRRVIFSPGAQAIHWGSASRGVIYYETEHLAFARRHGTRADAHFSPRWRLAGRRLTVDPGHHEWLDRGARALHVLLITHNLNYEGAPLFLFEYARWLREREGWTVSVLACEDGPLRTAYAALGATITLVDRHRLAAAESAAMYRERLREVIARLDLSNVDLVVGNTVVSWWAVHLAAQAGLPSLLYIHESTTLERFFRHALHEHMKWIVPDAFRRATRVNFLCTATARYYRDCDVGDRFRINPGWIDTTAIEAYKAAHSRASARARLGLAPDETVIINVGTVCERKGQHVWLDAIAHYQRHQPAAGPHRFVMVGGQADFFEGLLRADLARRALPGVEIVGKTGDAYAWWRAADLFVCTSFEESWPRVLLEAMAFEVPFVTTDVHGIPEMVTHDSEGFVIPPGDAPLLAHMMRRALDKSRTENSLVPMAFSKVQRSFAAERVLPRHVALARETYLAGPAGPPAP